MSLDPDAVDRDVAFTPTGRADRRGPFATRVVRVVVVVLLAAAALLVLGNTVGPRILGYKTYFVRSGSMKPTIPVGALALYRPVAATKLKVGDVIAFSRPGHNGDTVSHRIVRFDPGSNGGFVTKGDSPQGKFIALMIVGLSLVALALAGIWRSSQSDPALLMPAVPFRSLRVSAGLVAPAAPALTTKSPLLEEPQPLKSAVVLSLVPNAPADATANSDLHDYLTIISCNTSLLLRSVPDGDESRAGLAAIAYAARRALRVLEGSDTTGLLVRDGPR